MSGDLPRNGNEVGLGLHKIDGRWQELVEKHSLPENVFSVVPENTFALATELGETCSFQ